MGLIFLDVTHSLVSTVNLYLLLKFRILKLYDGILLIACTVVLGEECKCFLIAPLRHEPTGRFRNEHGAANDDKRWRALKDKGKTPCPIIRHLLSCECDTSSRNGAAKPPTIIKASHASAPLRRTYLDAVRRRGCGKDGHTEAENKATTHKLGLMLR